MILDPTGRGQNQRGHLLSGLTPEQVKERAQQMLPGVLSIIGATEEVS